MTSNRPSSPFDTLDTVGVMAVLQISSRRTLAKLIEEEGLPCHRVGDRIRVFIRGEVLEWIKCRCIANTPAQKVAS